MNLAVASFEPSRLLNVHVAAVVPFPDVVPEQLVHATVEPVEADAVSVTVVPWSKPALPELLAG